MRFIDHWLCSIFWSQTQNYLLHLLNSMFSEISLLYYFVTFKISTENFKIVFYYFFYYYIPAIFSSHFLMKLICWGIFVFVCFYISLYKWAYDNFGNMSNLISFLLYSNCFLTSRQVFHRFSFVCHRLIKK